MSRDASADLFAVKTPRDSGSSKH